MGPVILCPAHQEVGVATRGEEEDSEDVLLEDVREERHRGQGGRRQDQEGREPVEKDAVEAEGWKPSAPPPRWQGCWLGIGVGNCVIGKRA